MSRNNKEQCFADLKRRILSTEFSPGAALDEVRLAEQYGISRTPMREVLQRLTGCGYAVQEDNRGTKVASMDISTMRTFFQTAPLVYANIARLAAENRTEAQLDALQEAQNDFARANGNGDAGSAGLANHRFHEIIGEMAHNPYLKAALERMLIDHTRLSQTFYRPASPQEKILVMQAQDQHDAMISAIEAREAALELLEDFDRVFGVLELRDREREAVPDELRGWLEEKISAREAAREAGDYERADEIREEIEARGVQLEDRPDGVRWKLRDAAALADR